MGWTASARCSIAMLEDVTLERHFGREVGGFFQGVLEEHGVEVSGQERFIAETFCTRAASRVNGNLDQVESNDDERMTAIAKLALKRGEYGYAFFDD